MERGIVWGAKFAVAGIAGFVALTLIGKLFETAAVVTFSAILIGVAPVVALVLLVGMSVRWAIRRVAGAADGPTPGGAAAPQAFWDARARSAAQWAAYGALGITAGLFLVLLLGPFLMFPVLVIGPLGIIGLIGFAAALAVRRLCRTGSRALERFGERRAADRGPQAAGGGPDDELAEAAARVDRIRRTAGAVVDPALAASLGRLAGVADGLLVYAAAGPRGRRLRLQLVRQLANVEAVAADLRRREEDATADAALAARAAAGFDRLSDDLEARRCGAAGREALETQARLDLLAQELGAAPAPRP